MTHQPYSTEDHLVHLLPHLFGFHPEASVVIAGITPDNEPLGILRTDLPADPARWRPVARGLVDHYQERSSATVPTRKLVAYICPDPADADYGPQSRLVHQSIAEYLRDACHDQDLDLSDTLYVTRTHYWPMLTTGASEGRPIPQPPAELDATGFPRSADVLTSLKPATGARAATTTAALNAAVRAMHAEIRSDGHQSVVDSGIALLVDTIADLIPDAEKAKAIPDTLAARLLLVLQYPDVVNAGLLHCEDHELTAARSLWLALARRCPASYTDHAAAPLGLYAFTTWAIDDDAPARLALQAAERCLPDAELTTFLLHILNTGFTFDHMREHLRELRATRSGPVTG
ncbi:DUF4192 domain-containing protein [Kitasatospora sp. NPDC056273]|uniref:DUF4192 domain-containing protein n=1 Tax=Kitasatospora sp. NPDC056273 TaxID=3345769 RepID=UPI0035DD7E3D